MLSTARLEIDFRIYKHVGRSLDIYNWFMDLPVHRLKVSTESNFILLLFKVCSRENFGVICEHSFSETKRFKTKKFRYLISLGFYLMWFANNVRL